MIHVYLIIIITGSFFVGFVSGNYYVEQQDKYTQGYDKGMCAIVRTVTGRPKCEVKEIKTMSGQTIRAAISLPN